MFAALIIYVPALEPVFDGAALGLDELAVPATVPFIVWGTDELPRWWVRRQAVAG